jgi:hypothetical protein
VSVYVEILIRAPLDALWAHTQTPALHERWDLRFTHIAYLPRASAGAPQRFRYATRIGFGMAIEGEGETVGERDLPDGSRSSALAFGSDDPRSLIRAGSGYWKYVPTPDGVRFLTRYDYRTRGGVAGWLVDRLVFRPLLGWATAWSFDRLRLWLERRVDPARALRHAIAHGVARGALGAMAAATAAVGFASPPPPGAALDALALSLAVAALGATGVVARADSPSASHCHRRPPPEAA